MGDDVAAIEEQLVVFDLGGGSFGVNISTVREIIQMQKVTRLPGTRDFVEGVINLRGSVIPVVDLRTRFGLERIERGKETRIMVINSECQDIGMIVDSVAEVLRISSDAIEPPSAMVTGSESEYLLGIVKLPDRLVTLLDANRLLCDDQQVAFAELVSQAGSQSQETAG